MRSKAILTTVLSYMAETDDSPEGSNDIAIINKILLLVGAISPKLDIELDIRVEHKKSDGEDSE